MISVNFLCLAAMLIQAYSGIVLSRYLFVALPINGGMATARVLHLVGSYWKFDFDRIFCHDELLGFSFLLWF